MTTDERERIGTGVGTLTVRTRGEGPPAVLWHSLFVDERSWGSRRGRLGPRPAPGDHHRAWAWHERDPGHRYSLDDCAAAAGEVLAALDIREPVDWVGNAWGGHVDAAGPSIVRALDAL